MSRRNRRKPTRHRYLRFIIPGIVLILLAVFLPRPNGLIMISRRQYRAGSLKQELKQIDRQIETLDSLHQKFNDPEFARDYASWLFSAPPESTGAGQ